MQVSYNTSRQPARCIPANPTRAGRHTHADEVAQRAQAAADLKGGGGVEACRDLWARRGRKDSHGFNSSTTALVRASVTCCRHEYDSVVGVGQH
jgi:hypothetical protein